jgi:CRISPR/Cas system-associated endonuclease Cas1
MQKVTMQAAMNKLAIIQKRIQQDQETVVGFCARDKIIVDPHADNGGSKELLSQKLQAIKDRRLRFLQIKDIINAKNAEMEVCVKSKEGGVEVDETKTMKQWLEWERNLYKDEERFWQGVAARQKAIMDQVGRNHRVEGDDAKAAETVFAVDLETPPRELMKLFTIKKELDTAKSVANAVETVEIPDEID